MQSRKPHGHALIECGVVVLLCLLCVAFRAWQSWGHPAYQSGEPTAFYPAEAGMQYRWAERLAHSEALPDVEQRAQWPEGLRIGIDVTPIMEYIAAWAWQLLPGRRGNFFDFSILFIALVSSLPVVLAYLTVRCCGGGVAGATFAGFLASFHPAAWDRVVRNFGRENFALCWVLVPVWLLLLLWRWHRGKGSSPWWKGALLLAAVGAQALAFASWHMARALFELHTALFWIALLVGWAGQRERRWLQVWYFLTAPLWFALPVLSARQYALTPNICALSVLALGTIWARSRPAQWGVAGLAAVAWWLMDRFSPARDDSHVVEVLLAKLRHWFVKPLDPSELTPEARLMWIEAFESPSIAKLVWYGGVPIVASLGFVIMARWRIAAFWRRDASFRTFAFFTGVWSLLSFERLVIFWAFGMAVGLGLLASFALRARCRWAAVFTAVVVLIVGAQAAALPPMPRLARNLHDRLSKAEGFAFRNRLADTRDLLAWLRTKTRPDDVIVAWFGLSSQIYAYADRPVVVQSKFENPYVRPKCIELAKALYGSPELLTGFCRRYGARYVVYEVPMVFSGGRQSHRYVAGLQQIPTTSTVALMQFWPHELERFRLVYQNRGFRVFVYDDDNKITLQQHSTYYGWYPLYDRQWCRIGAKNGVLEDEQLEQALRRAEEFERLLALAQALKAEGRLSEALELARRILAQEPRAWQAAVLMARIYAASGNTAAAEKACREAEVGYPKCPELPAHLTRGRSLRDANR